MTEVIPKIEERLSSLEKKQELQEQRFELVVERIESHIDDMSKSLSNHVDKANDTMDKINESMKSYTNFINNKLEEKGRERDERERKTASSIAEVNRKTAVMQEDLKLLKKLVYGAVGLVLVEVGTAVIYLIIK